MRPHQGSRRAGKGAARSRAWFFLPMGCTEPWGPGRRRENPDQNRQGGGPRKRLLTTVISLISLSINLCEILDTSEEEQSRLEKKEHAQAPEKRQCLGLVLGMGLGRQTDGGMMQALPESPRLTELKAGLTPLFLQGPNSRRAQNCSRERTISTDSGPALDSHEVLGLSKGLSLLLHLP